MIQILKNNLFMLRYYFKYAPAYAISQTIYTIFVSAVWTLQGPITVKYVFDALSERRDIRELIGFLLLVSFVILVRQIFACISVEYLAPAAEIKVEGKMRAELFSKAAGMDLAYYETPQFYTDYVWAASQAQQRAKDVYNTFLELTAKLSEILFLGGVIVSLDSTLFLFAAAGLAVEMIFSMKHISKKYAVDNTVKPVEREVKYTTRVFYLNSYAKEIRLSNIHKTLFQRFRKAMEKIRHIYRTEGKKLARLQATGSVLSDIVLSFFLYVFLVYKLLVLKTLSFGDVMALINSTNSMVRRLSQFIDFTMKFAQHSLYIENFRKFLRYCPKIEKQSGEMVPREGNKIVLKDVSFSYVGEEKRSLSHINLTIHPREKVAVVGYNGAGKSTLVKLLMRLYDAEEGGIFLDGNDIKKYDIESYRAKFGAVFQDYQVFAGTIAENVAMGFVQKKDRERIIWALEKSGFSDKLKTLPLGIDTPLTREFSDDGINLSGGEAQKIAIARVFYKECDFVILDEPSSALDPVSEYKLNQAMLEAAKDKTVIFISHRLSTTCIADRIYMLENGTIIEEGSHEQLMKKHGKYAEMFLKQAEKYRMGN
jgi:ATP-binding cassette subfamily B protein